MHCESSSEHFEHRHRSMASVLLRTAAQLQCSRRACYSCRQTQRCVAARAGVEVISTDNAPAALGPYSQAIKTGSTLYISGQIGFNPKTMEFAGGSVEEQTDQVMANLDAILTEAGGTFANVVKTTVLLADMTDFAAVNSIYEKAFIGKTPPARACFAVKTLPKNALVEIEAIAEL